MTEKQIAKIREVLVWLHTHSATYEILMEDFDGDPYMGYYDRNAADVSDTIHQILERKDIKYRADQVFKAIKYERSHPEIAKEIDEYMRRNGIVKVFP